MYKIEAKLSATSMKFAYGLHVFRSIQYIMDYSQPTADQHYTHIYIFFSRNTQQKQTIAASPNKQICSKLMTTYISIVTNTLKVYSMVKSKIM